MRVRTARPTPCGTLAAMAAKVLFIAAAGSAGPVSLQDAYDGGNAILIPSAGLPVAISTTDADDVALALGGGDDPIIQFTGPEGGVIDWPLTKHLTLSSGGVAGVKFGPDTHGNPAGMTAVVDSDTFLRYHDGRSLFIGPEAEPFGIMQLVGNGEIKYFKKIIFEGADDSASASVEWNQAAGNLRLWASPVDSYEIKLPTNDPDDDRQVLGIASIAGTVVQTEWSTRAFGGLTVTADSANAIGAAAKASLTTTLLGLAALVDDDGGTANRLRYTGAKTRRFTVQAALSITSAGAADVVLHVMKNGALGSLVDGSEVHVTIAAASTVTVPFGSIVELATNDYVEIWITVAGAAVTVEGTAATGRGSFTLTEV